MDESNATGLHGSGRPKDQASQGMGAAAGEIGKVVSDKAEELAARSTKAGVDAVSTLGRTAETVASSLQAEAPAVAAYVRSAGHRIDGLADDLRDKKVGDLLAMASDFGRRQPLVLLAGAALVGFALARVVKSGVGSAEAATHSDVEGGPR